MKFQKRRHTLSTLYPETLFIIPSGEKINRSASVRYQFNPNSDFSYLCGLIVSGAYLILRGDTSYLLIDTQSDSIWGDELTLSSEEAKLIKNLNINPTSKIRDIIQSHSGEFRRIAISIGYSPQLEQTLLSLISYNRNFQHRFGGCLTLADAKTLIGTLRLFKDQEEIQNLKEAAERSSKVHSQLLQQNLIGRTELEIGQWIEAQFLLEGMPWSSYETIVGSGERSTLLHARATNRVIQNNELVLIDAGAKWKGYCADITRVLPSGATFTHHQKLIYHAVLQSQKLAIKAVKPGVSLEEIHLLTQQALYEQLLQIPVFADHSPLDLATLMPHKTSHWLGLDVHDPLPYRTDSGTPIQLKEGMTFTIEPGLYFRSNETFQEFRGIGIRIEDDIVVTKNGYSVLSSAPKEIEEIQDLRSKSSL